jgi:hypothetical protein
MQEETMKKRSPVVGMALTMIGFAIVNFIASFWTAVILLGGPVDPYLKALKLAPACLLALMQPWGIALWFLTEEPTVTIVIGTLISGVLYRALWTSDSHRAQRLRWAEQAEEAAKRKTGAASLYSAKRLPFLPPNGMSKWLLAGFCVLYLTLLIARSADFPVADRSVPFKIREQMKSLEIPISGSCRREIKDYLDRAEIWCGEMSQEHADALATALGFSSTGSVNPSYLYMGEAPSWWDIRSSDITWEQVPTLNLSYPYEAREVLAFSASKGKLYYSYFDRF